MSDPTVKRFPFAKIVVVLAVAFGVGLGLCGLDAALLEKLRSPGNEFGPNTIVGAVGAFAVLLSASGLVVTTIVWAVVSAVGGFSRKGSEPQRLFEGKDDENKLN